MGDFEAIGEMTSADLERVRALILPETLPVIQSKCPACGEDYMRCECGGRI